MLVSSTKPRRGEKQKTQEERRKQNKAKEKGERKRNGTTQKLKKQEGEHLGARNFWALGKKEIAFISIAKSPYYPTLFSIKVDEKLQIWTKVQGGKNIYQRELV
jgi:hypothetical protein